MILLHLTRPAPFTRLALLTALLALATAHPSYAGLSAFTQPCWAAPPTTATDDFLGPEAFVGCTNSGSANVTTPGPNGDQLFNGVAFAQAAENIWKVSYDLTVSNYMRDLYQWSTDASSPQVAPTTASAQAILTDTLTVNSAGGPGVYSMNFLFSVDGTLSSSDQALLQASFCVSLFIPEGTGQVTSFCRTPGQPVPSTFILTYADLPFGGPIDPTLIIAAGGFISPLAPDEVGTAADTILNGEMHVNFGSTVHLDTVLITDNIGNLIPGVDISSKDGFSYPLAAVNQVPEPGWLVLPGLAAVFVLKRLTQRQ